MTKRFYCQGCADVGRVGYKARVKAYSDAAKEIVYICEQCGRGVQIVDELCDHEWHVSAFIMERTCQKCGLKQVGEQPAIVWRNA